MLGEVFSQDDSFVHHLDPRVKTAFVAVFSLVVALNNRLLATIPAVNLAIIFVFLARLSINDIEIPYVFISHDMDFIGHTADKVYGMADGRIFLEEERVIHTHVHTHGYGQLPHTHSNGKK